MSSLNGKRVLIFSQRGWGVRVGGYLAKKLSAEGCRLATITSTIHEEIVNQTDVKYELIINHDQILSNPKKYLGDDDYSIEEICEELGVDSIWPLLWSVRMYTRSYKDKYYYGFKKNVEDEVMLYYVKAVYKCIKQFFNEFKPDIILAPNFVSLYHIMFNLYGRHHDARMPMLTESKVSGYYFFVDSYLEDVGDIFERIKALNDGKVESQNFASAKKYIEESRVKIKTPMYMLEDKKSNKTDMISMAKKFMRFLKKCIMWYIKRPVNPWESVGISTQYRSPRYLVRDFFASRKYKKLTNSFPYYPLEKVKKFVFLPLQTQPEITIDVAAPYFSNQIETARLVAMSLPDEYTLVVKDHPAMFGYQTPSYLEKLARTVNVKLVDYRIPSEDIIKKADLVISTGGTILAEAAFHYKPAIQLGELGTTLALPNVIKHNHLPTLSQRIKESLKIDLHNSDYENKLRNYISAIMDVGYNINISALWSGRDLSHLEELWIAYKTELTRLFR